MNFFFSNEVPYGSIGDHYFCYKNAATTVGSGDERL